MQVLGDVPRKGARLHPRKECMVFEGYRLTYRELDERVNRLANYLLSLNLGPIKHVAVLAENCHQYMEIYFGVAKAGYVMVPLNFRLAVQELATIVKDAEARVIFFGQGYEDTARDIAGQTGVDLLVSIEGAAGGCAGYEDLLATMPATDSETPVDENQMAVLMYTGGTTGKPKGVMLTHRNLMTAALDLTMAHRFVPNDVTCFILPMFHASLWPLICAFIVGAKAAILRRPDLTRILELIESEKCTHINAVPTIFNWLMAHPELDRFDLSSLKRIGYAGSPMAPELLNKMLQKFGNALFFQGYGLTEAAPSLTTLLPEDHLLDGPPEMTRRLRSVGREMLMTTVRVVREDGCEVAPGEMGEIVATGKNIMAGYWKRPEQTAEALRGGWLHTGDLGTVDEEGFIYLVDRKNDMIVTGGENVYAREVEDVLHDHPAVMEAVVVGVPDDRWGESVKALIVLKKDMQATEEDIIKFAKVRLSHYKCPKSVEFRPEIPKTAVGKVLRSELKKQFWHDRDSFIG